MNKTGYFVFSSALLQRRHSHAIGPAIWLYLWLIAHTTMDKLEQGERLGVVNYGHPVSLEQIAAQLAFGRRTLQEHLVRLEQNNYVMVQRTAAGPVVTVRNSTRWLLRDEKGGNHGSRTERRHRTGQASPERMDVDWAAEAQRGW